MLTRTRIAVMAVAVVSSVVVTEARVTHIEIVKVESPASGGRAGVSAGPYERITGKAHGELDPNDPKNALITDIKLAPRNARGKVEYVATFSLMKPIDMTQSSGVLIYSVVNRGNGAAAAERRGARLARERLAGRSSSRPPPIRRSRCRSRRIRTARSITGPLILRFTGLTGTTATLMIPRNQPSPYPPATLDTSKASLVSAVSESATGVKSGTVAIAGSRLGVRRLHDDAVPGKARCHPDLPEERFQSGAAVRAAVHREGSAGAGDRRRGHSRHQLVLPLREAGRCRHGESGGGPNSLGDFRRAARSRAPSCELFIQLGFNQDEQGRIVWDGSNPHIASRVIDLNRRFAMPGGTVSFYELGMEAPVWWEDWNDTARGRGKAGLLDRCRAVEHLPEDHGDVRQRRDLGAARVAHAGRHRRQGRHSAARQCSPLLLPRRDARRRAGRLQHDHRRRLPAAATCRSIRRRSRRCDRRC